jgi:hypothetical protein
LADVIPALAYVVMALAGAAAVWGVVTAIADKPPGKAQLLFAAGVWLVVLAQSVIAGVRLVVSFDSAAPATLVGYLIGVVVLIPVAWFWANSERTRYSGLVLAVAAFSVMAMTLRLLTLWVPAG